ncbi:protein misato homolog 1-like [Watersipora subatra]|uniref:protein misato homolog 1-like n=1 Tax=Watersipora subatra TaxID=2589382 RepID=UPI00355C1FF9
MSEIVTLQLGQLSNFVGTHWWNVQEASFVYEGQARKYKSEINHNATFREGNNLKNEITYTPRLIAVDLADSLNNIKLEGSLYDFEPEAEAISWSHEVTIHKQEEAYQKNEFLKDLDALDNVPTKETKLDGCTSREEMELDENLPDQAAVSAEMIADKLYNLDDSVKSWSDYLKTHLHPRSLSVVKKFYHSDNSFNIHGTGVAAYRNESLDMRSDMEDKVHFFTEEADNLQGFNLITDIYDGFGGFATALAAEVADDFAKKGCIAFCPFQSVRNTQESSQSLHDLINTVQSLVKFAQTGFTVVPLSMVDNPWVSAHHSHKRLPGVMYKHNLPYHTSAIFAAALDCATLSNRLLCGSLPLAHLTDTLSVSHRMVSNLSIAMPVPLDNVRSPMEAFATCCNPMTSLTPLYNASQSATSTAQSLALRGVRDLCSSPFSHSIDKWMRFDPSMLTLVDQPCSIKAPFPHIFESSLGKTGCNCGEPRPKSPAVEIQSVATLTSLSTSDNSKGMLSHLLERSSKLTQRHLHKHIEAGLEEDDWTETVNDLRGLLERYSNESEELDSD